VQRAAILPGRQFRIRLARRIAGLFRRDGDEGVQGRVMPLDPGEHQFGQTG
jgi:hypothetical protein